jgi:hypothetical protein
MFGNFSSYGFCRNTGDTFTWVQYSTVHTIILSRNKKTPTLTVYYNLFLLNYIIAVILFHREQLT